MAIWSLVISILTLGGIGSIAGAWLGIRARGRIDQTGERGCGLAIAGIIVCVITLLFAIGYWVCIAKYAGGGHGGAAEVAGAEAAATEMMGAAVSWHPAGRRHWRRRLAGRPPARRAQHPHQQAPAPPRQARSPAWRT